MPNVSVGSWYDWAATGFEAARSMAGHENPAQRRRHGHSFWAEIRVPRGSVPQEGRLVDRMQGASALLDYQDLNALLPAVDDQALLSWIEQQAERQQGDHGFLSAGPRAGVMHDAQGRWYDWFLDRFEASHFLPQVPVGHKCGRLHGHGFEVMLLVAHNRHRVTQVWQALWSRLHGHCLNDIAGLEIPTSEVLAAWLWHQMAEQEAPVAKVVVFETASCASEFDGVCYRVWKKRSFDSALWTGNGRMGHTFQLTLGLSAPMDEALGWVMDFGDIQRLFEPLYRELDHQPLHEQVPHASSHGVLTWLVERARPLLPALDRVDLCATPKTGVTWSLSGGVEGPSR